MQDVEKKANACISRLGSVQFQSLVPWISASPFNFTSRPSERAYRQYPPDQASAFPQE